jgi:hypothetical protein
MPPSRAPKELELTASKNYEPPTEWQSTASLLSPKRPPTPLERQAIAEVHELADAFAAGSCSLAEVQAATEPEQRNLAVRYTSPKQAEWPLLMTLLDALIAESKQTAVTSQGAYPLSELIDAGMRIVHRAGQEVIQLRSCWPWRVRPDPERGIDGIRGEPVFRDLDERGPAIGHFSVVQAAATPRAAKWWQDASSEEQPF